MAVLRKRGYEEEGGDPGGAGLWVRASERLHTLMGLRDFQGVIVTCPFLIDSL